MKVNWVCERLLILCMCNYIYLLWIARQHQHFELVVKIFRQSQYQVLIDIQEIIIYEWFTTDSRTIEIYPPLKEFFPPDSQYWFYVEIT